ncbi:CFI-box-CTERM domain-containing protein [Thermodesulfobacteriota bacterium]
MKRVIILSFVMLLFLATFCHAKKVVDYNDPRVSKEVNTLRKFRDFHLKKYALGRKFVRFYYKYGPLAAKAIAGVRDADGNPSGRGGLRSLVRLSLLPLMYAGKHFPGVLFIIEILGSFLIFHLLYYLSFRKRVRMRKRITIYG